MQWKGIWETTTSKLTWKDNKKIWPQRVLNPQHFTSSAMPYTVGPHGQFVKIWKYMCLIPNEWIWWSNCIQCIGYGMTVFLPNLLRRSTKLISLQPLHNIWWTGCGGKRVCGQISPTIRRLGGDSVRMSACHFLSSVFLWTCRGTNTCTFTSELTSFGINSASGKVHRMQNSSYGLHH